MFVTNGSFVNEGVVKKLGSSLTIVEDYGRNADPHTDDIRAALSHMKDRPAFQAIHVLRPVKVLALFKRMLDVVIDLLFCKVC